MGEIAVAPLVGAWIETMLWSSLERLKKSLPSWERGLKQPDIAIQNVEMRRSPRGSVD